MDMAQIFQTAVQISLEALYVISPILVIVFIVRWHRALAFNLPDPEPLAVLVNVATRDVTHIMSYETAIGRSRSSDIILNFPAVSRNHAVLCFRNDQWRIYDTNSKTGVYVNGQKIDKMTQIVRGDTITLGGISLAFSDQILDD